MSRPSLPQEIADDVVDLLHDELGTLKRCCLVSKSWIPRSRKHLFRKVSFLSLENLEAWKDIFPDPLDSPAHYARSLHIDCAQVIPAAVSEASSWIRAFSNVVRLTVSVSEIRSDLFKLICSLPLLEDLDVISREFSENDDDDTAFNPSTSPPLTGTLGVALTWGMESFTRQLLELPGGVSFRRITYPWHGEDDLRWVRAMVEKCVDTLECIEIECTYLGEASIDLSEVIRLKEVKFVFDEIEDVWTTVALKTITFKHTQFKKVSIFIPVEEFSPLDKFGKAPIGFGQAIFNQWMDFDRVLVQLWESHAIHTQVTYSTEQEEKEAHEYIGILLPEMTKRGRVEMVDERDLF